MTARDWELLRQQAGPLAWPEIYLAIIAGAILGVAIFETIIHLCGN
jgi:hypothetical protein